MRTDKIDVGTLQALWTLQALTSSELPALAADLLAQGVESPAIVELAGLVQPTSWETDPVLRRVFREAALPEIEGHTALWRVAYATARAVVAGAVAPREGAAELWGLAAELEMPESLRYFIYLAADYGGGPDGPEWFDDRIRAEAADLLSAMPADGQSPPTSSAGT